MRVIRSSSALLPLDAVDAAFRRLAGPPAPLTLPAYLLAEEAEADAVPVDLVRARLVHPSTPAAARDRVWAEVVERAHRIGEPWTLVAAGMALPGLRRVLARHCRCEQVDAEDLQQEVLTAVCTGLDAVDCAEGRIAQQLWNVADRAAQRAVYRARRAVLPLDEEPEPAALPQEVRGGEYQVLADLLACGVLTPQEAYLIARTRIEGVPLERVAREAVCPVAWRQLYRRRHVAEKKLAAALREQDAE